MKPEIDYTLYLVTDSALCPWMKMPDAVERAIQGGVTLVQLREKEVCTKDFYEIAVRVKEVTDRYHIPLLINDRIDIALAVDAAGVHIGQSDMPIVAARRILGKDKIIGLSTGTVQEALEAERNGADYIGFGAVYYTDTKKIDSAAGPKLLKEAKKAVSIPVVGIGGIHKENIAELRGIDGVAVVSAIMGQSDEKIAARELLDLWKGKKE